MLLKIINFLIKVFFLHKGDLLDFVSLNHVINKVEPNEIYNFADQDHVGWSYEIPSYSFKTTALSVIEILEILKKNNNKKIKYFQPISSNIFGHSNLKKQNEATILNPNSIYGLAKATAYQACKMYSRTYKLFLCGAIYFNHESPKRSNDYVTKKIVENVCAIYHGKKKDIYLGDIKAKIDWGYAKDYVECAWEIMQLNYADDFIICTGEVHSVKEFLNEAFAIVNLNPDDYVMFDPKYARPSDTSFLVGDTSKAKEAFGFEAKVTFKKLVKLMVENDISELKH